MKDTGYTSMIKSSVPIMVQHTRLEPRKAANPLSNDVAFAVTVGRVA